MNQEQTKDNTSNIEDTHKTQDNTSNIEDTHKTPKYTPQTTRYGHTTRVPKRREK